MENEQKKALRKYLWTPAPFGLAVLLLVIGLVFGLLAPAEAVFLALPFVVLAAVVVIPGVMNRSRMSRQLKALEQSGALRSVLRDFAQSESFFKNELRVGDTYLFGKKYGLMVRYDQIEKIYQKVQKRNHVEIGRFLMVKVAGSGTRTLCKVARPWTAGEELEKFFGLIQQKNPNVHLGYQ